MKWYDYMIALFGFDVMVECYGYIPINYAEASVTTSSKRVRGFWVPTRIDRSTIGEREAQGLESSRSLSPSLSLFLSPPLYLHFSRTILVPPSI